MAPNRELAAADEISPRRFALDRITDVSGVSGVGRVADGVLWPDGSASIRWRGEHPSVVFWATFESVEFVHGHGGATVISWLDPPACAVLCGRSQCHDHGCVEAS